MRRYPPTGLYGRADAIGATLRGERAVPVTHGAGPIDPERHPALETRPARPASLLGSAIEDANAAVARNSALVKRLRGKVKDMSAVELEAGLRELMAAKMENDEKRSVLAELVDVARRHGHPLGKIMDLLDGSGLDEPGKVAAMEEVQSRLARKLLEEECSRIFDHAGAARWPAATLFLVTAENTAFKTNLKTTDRLVATIRNLLQRWGEGGAAKKYPSRVEVPDRREVEKLMADARLQAGPDTHVLLMFGDEHAQYASTLPREEAARLLGEFAVGAADARIDELELESRALQVVRDWHCPAGEVRTASHRELHTMNVSHVLSVLELDEGSPEVRAARREALLAIEARHERFRSLMRANLEVALGADASADYQLSEAGKIILTFGKLWRQSSYARLEVGHKLAASFCLTDMPDDFPVDAPWGAWSLVVPDGLMPDVASATGEAFEPARLWCVGTDIVAVVASHGGILKIDDTVPPSPAFVMLRNLMRSACLALSEPDDFRKERQGKAGSSSRKNRHGPPDLDQARFMLSAPVKIDFRDQVHEVLTGRHKGGGVPKVQFLVRGHPKMQVHGKGRALRKRIWVKPFWKGPEDARVLLRQHRMEE